MSWPRWTPPRGKGPRAKAEGRAARGNPQGPPPVPLTPPDPAHRTMTARVRPAITWTDTHSHALTSGPISLVRARPGPYRRKLTHYPLTRTTPTRSARTHTGSATAAPVHPPPRPVNHGSTLASPRIPTPAPPHAHHPSTADPVYDSTLPIQQPRADRHLATRSAVPDTGPAPAAEPPCLVLVSRRSAQLPGPRPGCGDVGPSSVRRSRNRRLRPRRTTAVNSQSYLRSIDPFQLRRSGLRGVGEVYPVTDVGILGAGVGDAVGYPCGVGESDCRLGPGLVSARW